MTKTKSNVPTKTTARKILRLLKHGLSLGKGRPLPGHMCVEAVVCFAMGLPHSDEPPCVGEAVRSFKILLNDSVWSSPMARAKGLRRVAIAQLGSNHINQQRFSDELTRLTVERIAPVALRAAAKVHPSPAHQDSLEQAAKKCASKYRLCHLALQAALESVCVVDVAVANVFAAHARDAAWSARSMLNLLTTSPCGDAETAAQAAVYARSTLIVSAMAKSNVEHELSAMDDEMLALSAELAVEALQICKCKGCEWLDLAPL